MGYNQNFVPVSFKYLCFLEHFGWFVRLLFPIGLHLTVFRICNIPPFSMESISWNPFNFFTIHLKKIWSNLGFNNSKISKLTFPYPDSLSLSSLISLSDFFLAVFECQVQKIPVMKILFLFLEISKALMRLCVSKLKVFELCLIYIL